MKTQKGITLIALVITIIVMLILVAVSVTVALNGGLFTTAKNATNETKTEVKAEQKLADGKIKIGDNWYASYQDYKDGKILEPGIILEESLKIEIPEEYDVQTAPVTKELTAILNEIEGNITWTVDNEEIATIVAEGTKVTITAVAAGTVKLTATCEFEGETYTAECEIKVKKTITIAKGDFVEYGVAYKDTYRAYEYTTANGWRLMDYTYNEETETYSNVKLISTGIPAILYFSTTTTNNEWWVEEEIEEEDDESPSLSEFRKILGGEENYIFYTGDSTYKGLQATAGMYYNFKEMKFAYSAGFRGKNLGWFKSISVYDEQKYEPTTYDANKTDEKSGIELFKVRDDASVRILTLPEVNKALGRTSGWDDSVDSVTTISEIEDSIGLYRLDQLKNIERMEKRSYNSGDMCWLASPYPYNTYLDKICVIRR